MLTEIVVMKEKKKVLVFNEKQRVLLTCSYNMIWTTRKYHLNIRISGNHTFKPCVKDCNEHNSGKVPKGKPISKSIWI
jgi:hypothetical protein